MTQLINNHESWWLQMIMSNNNKHELLVITICALILAILWLWWSTFSNGDGLPPGPRSLPIVGYLPFLSPELHRQFTNMARTYGPIFKLHVGAKLFVVISSPDMAKAVVHAETFANRVPPVAAMAFSYQHQDLIWSNGPYWRNMRKIFVHEVLGAKNLKACYSFLTSEVRKTVKNVYSKMGTAIEVNEVSFATEANVIMRLVWENSADKGGKDGHLVAELHMVVSKIMELVGKPNISDIFPSLAWFDPQGIDREMKKNVKWLDRILTDIIDDRIKSNSNNSKGEVVGDVGKKDALQMLLELKDQKDATSLSITQVKALLMDTMIAGADTSTTSIEWAMTEIMKNDKVMKRIQEELGEIVGPNNIVEESHLPKLQYLDATIKETLRLHPVAPLLLPRSPTEASTIGGYTIPKGCTVFLNVWAIHRDARYWENPLEFNPDRFLTNKYDLNGNNFTFMPFGSGRRLCPGIPLAVKMQMYILASLLHSFDWSLPKGEEHDFADKFGVSLKKRKPLMAIPSQRLPNVSLYM